MHEPLVSIITVTYNAGASIKKTIDSVVCQLDCDIEYILIDGGSTDETTSIVNGYRKYFHKIISEADAGIYDAMNKGAALARGRFLLHINAGDTLQQIPKAQLRAAAPEAACLAFPVQISGGKTFKPTSGLGLRFHNTLHHQGCFYRRAGLPVYDLQYKVFADFDLNQRIAKSGRTIKADNSHIVAHHDTDGISNNTSRFHEVYSIVRSNHGPLWLAACFAYFKLMGIRQRLGLA